MRIVLVSDRYGAFTGFPAWTLELRFHGPLRPGYERERGYTAAWGLGHHEDQPDHLGAAHK